MCIALCVVNATSAVVCILGQRKSGLPAFSAAAIPLLTLTAGFGIFAVWFPRLSFGSVLWIVLGCLVIMGTVALFAAGKISGLKMLAARWVADLLKPFERPLIGGSLSVVLVGVVVALLLVTPWLYPKQDEVIAYGTQDIGIGRTEEGHNWIGAEAPEVVIVEYSDYECPYCRKAHEVIRQVVRERKDWLRLVHVHVPLDHSCNPMLRKPFHRHACDCARAAICADRQNRFWVMNDALFVRRCGLDAGGLAMLAEKLGLDVPAFRTCMQEQETEDILQDDLAECRDVADECRRMGRRFGTPTFIVGDQVISGLKKREFWVRLVESCRRSP
jgi:protein-disulfide isomerase